MVLFRRVGFFNGVTSVLSNTLSGRRRFAGRRGNRFQMLSDDHKQTKKAGREVVMSSKTVTPNTGCTHLVPTAMSTSSQPPVAGVASPLAYLHRLQQGRFESIVSLMSAPYAPHPLRVLSDVLHEALHLKRVLAGEFDEETAGRWQAQWSNTLKMVDCLKESLSDPSAVRVVVEKGLDRLREASEAASEIGDVFSEQKLQEELREVGRLADELRSWGTPIRSSDANFDAYDERCRDFLSWSLGDAVRVEIRRGLLMLCSITGASTLATESLNELISLSELDVKNTNKSHTRQHGGREGSDLCGEKIKQNEEGEVPVGETFSLDSVVDDVERELRHTFTSVGARDHILAIQSCAPTRSFDTAYSLFQRFIQHAECGMFHITVDDITAALVGLARCSGNTDEFTTLQEVIVNSKAACVVPVSVELYTSLIDAVSRAPDNSKCLEVALALYRQLRDGGLEPSADTYAALIACCATVREPTTGFGFYHEALQQCGVRNLTPAVYTNLLLAYARAGYGADARKTLEVLMEAGAPLTRSAFHAVLSCAVSQRDAEEVLQLMQRKYNISPNPQTYAYLIAVAGATASGATTVLSIFDLQELAFRSLLDRGNFVEDGAPHTLLEKYGSDKAIALSTSDAAPVLEKEILSMYPAYGEAIEFSLMQLRVDPKMDPRLDAYMRPLVRVAQQRMNAFTKMAPQVPTRVPKGASVAVLAADILGNVEQYLVPFISYYSVVVIPYSSLVAMQHTAGGNPGTSRKDSGCLSAERLCREFGSARRQMVKERRSSLLKFLNKYRDTVHLVSLAEEISLSRDCDRYGINVKKTFARCAALAINLARMDVPNAPKIYAEQECDVVLVSTNFEQCGRFVVDIKREILRERGTEKKGEKGPYSNVPGLKAGMQRVLYHNPRTSPQWRPPSVSVASLVRDSNLATMNP